MESSKKPPRVMTPLRLSGSAREWLDSLAEKYRVPRSVVIRHALVIARRHEAELTNQIKENS